MATLVQVDFKQMGAMGRTGVLVTGRPRPSRTRRGSSVFVWRAHKICTQPWSPQAETCSSACDAAGDAVESHALQARRRPRSILLQIQYGTLPQGDGPYPA
uniref:Uncharacterized protein n=1 Tax=Peronospora matthiolae TaxID=2874970 RepID=A0AAV1T264_9STRA